MNVTVDC
jgi:hypothetical protein